MRYHHTISIAAAMLLLNACTKEGSLTQNRYQEFSTENSVLLQEGTFVPTDDITVAGAAQLRKTAEAHFIWLHQFSVSSGPDLKVYLSKTSTPTEFVNLGPLTNHASYYSIPAEVDLSQYPYVLIHCQQYNHLFAIANLYQ
jgi:hypothetical protein